jgi:hypothetical protein
VIGGGFVFPARKLRAGDAFRDPAAFPCDDAPVGALAPQVRQETGTRRSYRIGKSTRRPDAGTSTLDRRGRRILAATSSLIEFSSVAPLKIPWTPPIPNRYAAPSGAARAGRNALQLPHVREGLGRGPYDSARPKPFRTRPCPVPSTCPS